jgi:hypothetical protein
MSTKRKAVCDPLSTLQLVSNIYHTPYDPISPLVYKPGSTPPSTTTTPANSSNCSYSSSSSSSSSWWSSPHQASHTPGHVQQVGQENAVCAAHLSQTLTAPKLKRVRLAVSDYTPEIVQPRHQPSSMDCDMGLEAKSVSPSATSTRPYDRAPGSSHAVYAAVASPSTAASMQVDDMHARRLAIRFKLLTRSTSFCDICGIQTLASCATCGQPCCKIGSCIHVHHMSCGHRH